MRLRGEKDPAWLNWVYLITFLCGGASVLGLYLLPPNVVSAPVNALLIVAALVGATGALVIGFYGLSRLLRGR